MSEFRPDRRRTYFLFQGLLTVVLLLLFIYEAPQSHRWLPRFLVIAGSLLSTLVLLKLASVDVFARWWIQSGLFLFDAGITALTLAWTRPHSDFFLLYVLILFGTALMRSFRQSFVLGLVTLLLYLLSGWKPGTGWPNDAEFWLRFNFLCVSTSLLAILSRDDQEIRGERERLYRERTIQVERLATLGQMAGEIAHRIKSPLTTILVNAEILSFERGKPKKALEEIAQIQEAARHCQEILKNLLDLGRIEEMEFAAVDLRGPVESALRSASSQLERRGISLETTGLDEPRMVHGEASLLHEAIAAVLQNAVDAVADGGRVRLALRTLEASGWPGFKPEPARHAVVVEDDGKGISSADLENVFQPFFSTKGAQGTGLGLSAALRILQKHGGTITASSPGPGQGACFELSLPALNRPSSRSGKAGRSARKSRSR